MTNILSSVLANSPGTILFINVLDILIIAFAIYKILELMQGTRAMPLVKGIAILLIFSVVSEAVGLSTVNWGIGAIAKGVYYCDSYCFCAGIAPCLRKAGERFLYYA